ncbi:MAG: transposase [Deltaproteobacteria bacterium]|nr:transposase [Deltaproteobacteria bacterium]
MARKPRIDFEGAFHHVMHRGARRAPIFKDDSHCVLFLDLLGEMAARYEIEVHAYSLMPNHYHLLLRSLHGNLSRGMRRLNADYTQRVNRIHGWDGPVFRGRFRSELVRDESSLPYVLAYIHLNPLRAGLVTRLQSECWTSHRAYLDLETSPEWLTRGFFLEMLGGGPALHEYVLDLHRGRLSWPERMALDAGWLRGAGEAALKIRDADAATRFLEPRRALALVCAVTAAGRDELLSVEHGPRANPARRFAVWALCQRTDLTHGTVGRTLRMTAAQVANVLRRFDREAEPMRAWVEAWEERLYDK